MCGIAGIISDNPTLLEALPRMVSQLTHRGPDDEGLEYLEGAALGHRRLSIIDLDAGHQPMFNSSGTVAVVYNGEIYNFPTLKRELEEKGHRFSTRSDTEVLLHLYEEHGEHCVRHLDGMFAFAIWDLRQRKLLLVRDHLGQKPLFFRNTPEGLAFASEVKGVLASGIVDREIDLEALYHYISLRFIPDQSTLFKGIRKLPAGHYLVFENGVERLVKYWDVSYRDKIQASEGEILDELDELLTRTVKEHTLSDVPVGSFLSGGIDSSTITAMMAKQSGSPVETFSIGVAEHGFNELPYARVVADQYHTHHHEHVAQADLIHLIPKMIWHLDEPSDPFGVGVYLVSQLAGKHVKVVLGGDGGDELFAGYDRFLGNQLIDYFAIIPPFFRKTLLKQVVNRMPEGYSYKSFSQKLRWFQAMSELDYGERYSQSMSFLRFTEEAKEKLFTAKAKHALGDVDSQEKILTHFNSENVSDLVDRMLYTDIMTRIPDHLLMIVDRMTMSQGLEARPPMLEHRFVEFAARVPSEMKLKGRTLKYALRKVASRHLPTSLISRKKQGFGFPLAYWMKNELKDFLRGIARDSRLVEHEIFESSYVNTLVEEHVGGKRDHNFRIWILINLEIWYRLYFDNQTTDSSCEYIDRLMSNGSNGSNGKSKIYSNFDGSREPEYAEKI